MNNIKQAVKEALALKAARPNLPMYVCVRLCLVQMFNLFKGN